MITKRNHTPRTVQGVRGANQEGRDCYILKPRNLPCACCGLAVNSRFSVSGLATGLHTQTVGGTHGYPYRTITHTHTPSCDRHGRMGEKKNERLFDKLLAFFAALANVSLCRAAGCYYPFVLARKTEGSWASRYVPHEYTRTPPTHRTGKRWRWGRR